MTSVFGFTWDDKNLLHKMENVFPKSNEIERYLDDRISLSIISQDTFSPLNNKNRESDEIEGYKRDKEEFRVIINDKKLARIKKNTIETAEKSESANSHRSYVLFSQKNGGKLLLGRTYIGSKQLYYLKREEGIVFSSCIRPLIRIKETIDIDKESLDSFLAFRYNLKQKKTLIEGIKKVPPNCYLEFGEKTSLQKIRDFKPIETSRTIQESYKSLKGALEAFFEELNTANRDISVLLSGGIDSSLIIPLLSNYKDIIHTYTLNLDEKTSKNSKIVSQLYGTEHHEIKEISGYFSDLLEMTWKTGMPVFDTTNIAVHNLYSKANEKSDLILTGTGSDEQLGGYELDMACYYLGKYDNKLMQNLLSRGVKYTPNFAYKKLTNSQKKFDQKFKKKISDSLNEKNLYDFHFRMNAILSEKGRKHLYEDKSLVKSKNISKKGDYTGKGFLNKLLYREQITKLESQESEPINNLSQYLGVQTGSPFLSPLIFNVTRKIPSKHKIRYGKRKYILRKVANDYLPREIYRTKKLHFSPPLSKWLRGERLEICRKILAEGNLEKHDIFKRNYVEKLFKRIKKSPFIFNRIIWSLTAFQLWYNIFIDQKLRKPPENIEKVI